MITEKFWMVYCPSGHAPTKRHWTKEDAEAEAERLARKTPEAEYCVLEALSVRKAYSVITDRRLL